MKLKKSENNLKSDKISVYIEKILLLYNKNIRRASHRKKFLVLCVNLGEQLVHHREILYMLSYEIRHQVILLEVLHWVSQLWMEKLLVFREHLVRKQVVEVNII